MASIVSYLYYHPLITRVAHRFPTGEYHSAPYVGNVRSSGVTERVHLTTEAAVHIPRVPPLWDAMGSDKVRFAAAF